MMVIDNEFNLGDVVYLKTDKEQLPRIVTNLKVTRCEVLYILSQGVNDSTHYNFELSLEINELMKVV